MKFSELADITMPRFDIFHAKQGPHRWSEITKEDFGEDGDFELYDWGNEFIFYPISNAALQWCYYHLPEDCPRGLGSGFRIEAENIKEVVANAERDGLREYEE